MKRKDAVSGEEERRLLSRKEVARMYRRAAYEKAKAARATDPRYLAMKQAAKEQRKAAYQVIKERRKAEAVKVKVQTRAKAEQERQQERAQGDAELMKTVLTPTGSWLSKGSSAAN